MKKIKAEGEIIYLTSYVITMKTTVKNVTSCQTINPIKISKRELKYSRHNKPFTYTTNIKGQWPKLNVLNVESIKVPPTKRSIKESALKK